MSIDASEFDQLPIPEAPPELALVHYLQGQFADAYNKEIAERERADRSLHGAFYTEVAFPVPGYGQGLVVDATKIVLKDDHPRDASGNYTEVVALVQLNLREYPDRVPLEAIGTTFYVREIEASEAGQWRSIGLEGVATVAETKKFMEREPSSAERARLRRASAKLLGLVGARNIVAQGKPAA